MSVNKNHKQNVVYNEMERIRLKGTNEYYYITEIENVFGKTWYYLSEKLDQKKSYMCVMYSDLSKVS